jgi:hypothetical protein
MSKLMFSFDGQRIHVDPNHGLTTVQLINTLSEIIEASRERANELIAELIDETMTDTEALSLPKNLQ